MSETTVSQEIGWNDEIDFSWDTPEETTVTAPIHQTDVQTVSEDSGSGFAEFKPIPQATVPEFPVECLPDVVQDYVVALANQLEVDVAMTAAAAMAVLALAAQHNYRLEIRPGWTVPVNLYVLIVAEASTKKSPVIRQITKPVDEWQRDRNAEYASIIDRCQTKISILEQSIRREQESIGRKNAKSAMEVADAVNNLKDQLRELKSTQVHEINLLLDDCTPEALASRMAMQSECAGLISTEAGAFDTVTGRYAANGTNADLFLKAWPGDPYQVSRIGRAGERMEQPLLTVLLGCQPGALRDVMLNPKLRDRGVSARFLYCYARKVRGSWYGAAAVPDNVAAAWNSLITTLVSGMDSIGEPIVLKLTSDPFAEKAAAEFYETFEEDFDSGRFDGFEEWSGKFREQVFRMAALMAIATTPMEPVITEKIMLDAIRIGGYFVDTARIAHEAESEDGSTPIADALVLWGKLERLGRTGTDRITERNLFRMVQNMKRFKRGSDEIGPGLTVLKKFGYIRIEERKTNGRTSYVVHINPVAMEH